MDYVELHCHSNYSFQEGASFLEELLARAVELGYHALALTDHDNLCGAMEFSRIANSIGVKPITGAEVTLADGSHLTLLARTRRGYSNLCNLLTASRAGMDGDRRDPRLNPALLKEHARGLVLLTGCSKGRVPSLVTAGRPDDAEAELRSYVEWFGPDNVFVELQQNLVYGDTSRNRRLVRLARAAGVDVVATNNVHYHAPERHRLQDALVAIRHNKTLEETHRERRANANFYLRSAEEMALHFRGLPEALRNTLRIAERCDFNLETNLGYRFPDYGELPDGHTAQSYLEQVCEEAAARKYGSITPEVRERLDEEYRLIRKHDLAGFFLIYYEVIQIAREVMIDLGHGAPEVPLEERPPGRGRGSSVAMLVGYLIGLSHIDPLLYGLSLDRFINDEMGNAPDIDIDFPRDIREETIRRVHERYGWERAALTGAIATYKMKGCIRDLGKALGIPAEDVDKLAKRVDARHAKSLKSEMSSLPDFRHKVDAPVWDTLVELAAELQGFPKYLMQHAGGMIISDRPLIDMVPVVPGGMEDRYVCQWDRDTVADAGFVKIDFLGLGALSQMQEALEIVERRTGKFIDLSSIDFDDQDVYDSIHRADTIGIFQIESAAQMQTVVRLKPRNLQEMAYEVAAVRPGVGVNDGVSQFIKRYRGKAEWDYDHPAERRALERTLGIILYQDQVNELAVEVAGFSYRDADNLRRAFGRKNNKGLIEAYWEKFREGAAAKGVPEESARKIFGKFSGQYMFPESHAYAFGVTAYQMSWLKLHYPLEFFVAIFNQQPMGFYNIETLKEDARRHGIRVLNPDVNESGARMRDSGRPFLHARTAERQGAGRSQRGRHSPRPGPGRPVPQPGGRDGAQRPAARGGRVPDRGRGLRLLDAGPPVGAVGGRPALPARGRSEDARAPRRAGHGPAAHDDRLGDDARRVPHDGRPPRRPLHVLHEGASARGHYAQPRGARPGGRGRGHGRRAGHTQAAPQRERGVRHSRGRVRTRPARHMAAGLRALQAGDPGARAQGARLRLQARRDAERRGPAHRGHTARLRSAAVEELGLGLPAAKPYTAPVPRPRPRCAPRAR